MAFLCLRHSFLKCGMREFSGIAIASHCIRQQECLVSEAHAPPQVGGEEEGEAHPAFGVGGLVIGGGLLGFLQKGSKGSLIGGSVLGAGFLGAGLLINKGEGFYGHSLASVSALSLMGMFGSKFMKSRAIFPAGLYTILGVASLAYHGKKANEWKE
eukprot:jgi/Bigna1/87421/estExt_fgenesh1_pg.C_200083